MEGLQTILSLKNVDAITVLEDFAGTAIQAIKETFSQIICFYIIYTVLNSVHSVKTLCPQ